MDDFPISTRLFISMVKEKPILWDQRLENFKSITATHKAWKEVILDLYPDFESWDKDKRRDFARLFVKKWGYVKHTFLKSEKKIEHQMKSGKSGDGLKITKRYIYYKDLQFLKDSLPPNSVENNNSEDTGTVQKEENTDEGNQSGTLTNENKIQSESSNTDSIKPPAKRKGPKTSLAKNIAKLPNFSEPMNRYISFFISLIPTLDKFDDDQAIEFQLGVLKLMKEIKNSKQTVPQETIPNYKVYLPKNYPISDPGTSTSNTYVFKTSPTSHGSNESLSDNSVNEDIDFSSF